MGSEVSKGNVDVKPLLEIKHLKTQFFIGNEVYHAVDDVSFIIRSQRTLALVGESGSGKSVTANSILQIVPDPPGRIVGGQIIFEGDNLLEKSEEEMRKIRGRKISMIFQEPMTSLNPIFRIGEQIIEAILLHQTFTDDMGKKLTTSAAKRQATTQTIEMLSAVGIPNPAQRMKDYPHQLSGGMRQRVMIAMALVCHPRLLIADEPTSALDVTVQAQILKLLREMQDEFNTAVLLITHDFGIVAENADDVAVMYAGQIVERGPAERVTQEPSHEYTRLLIASAPDPDAFGRQLPARSRQIPARREDRAMR